MKCWEQKKHPILPCWEQKKHPIFEIWLWHFRWTGEAVRWVPIRKPIEKLWKKMIFENFEFWMAKSWFLISRIWLKNDLKIHHIFESLMQIPGIRNQDFDIKNSKFSKIIFFHNFSISFRIGTHRTAPSVHRKDPSQISKIGCFFCSQHWKSGVFFALNTSYGVLSAGRQKDRCDKKPRFLENSYFFEDGLFTFSHCRHRKTITYFAGHIGT